MAAIEYFTEPGDHLSILIILIDIVIVIEYLTGPGDQLLVIAQINRPPLPINIVVVIATVDTKKTPRHHQQIKKPANIKKNTQALRRMSGCQRSNR